jgi:hypothetical protein
MCIIFIQPILYVILKNIIYIFNLIQSKSLFKILFFFNLPSTFIFSDHLSFCNTVRAFVGSVFIRAFVGNVFIRAFVGDTPNKGPYKDTPNKGPYKNTPNKGPYKDTPNKSPYKNTPNKGLLGVSL